MVDWQERSLTVYTMYAYTHHAATSHVRRCDAIDTHQAAAAVFKTMLRYGTAGSRQHQAKLRQATKIRHIAVMFFMNCAQQ